MSEDEFERTLREAFDARARAGVSDSVGPPPPRFLTTPATQRRRRRTRLLAPLAAAAAVLGVVTSVAALQHDSSGGKHDIGVGSGSSGVASAAASDSVPPPSEAATTSKSRASTLATPQVHIKLHNSDGAVYGVGMPVVAYFSGMVADGRTLTAATSVTVNGKPAHGAWYFEKSTVLPGYPLEGHLRLATYWPAHSKVHVALATQGRPAATDATFDDSLTLDFSTGARTIARVDDRTHRMTVTTDGKPVGAFPVSLGLAKTPTMRGTKVIMAKGAKICQSGPGYNTCDIRYAEQLSYSGEYLHAAPWNVANIKAGINSSGGATNLLTADAKRLYGILEVGDVVEYPNASGPPMTMGVGFADWNVPWKVWLLGGAVPNR